MFLYPRFNEKLNNVYLCILHYVKSTMDLKLHQFSMPTGNIRNTFAVLSLLIQDFNGHIPCNNFSIRFCHLSVYWIHTHSSLLYGLHYSDIRSKKNPYYYKNKRTLCPQYVESKLSTRNDRQKLELLLLCLFEYMHEWMLELQQACKWHVLIARLMSAPPKQPL